MTPARLLFGLYHPGTSWLHRWGAGAKYALVLALTVPLLLWQRPLPVLALVVTVIALLVSARLPWRPALGLPAGLVWLLAGLVSYHALVTDWRLGASVALSVIGCLYAARLVTLTTPAAVLIDAIVTGVRPLRRLGVSPERVGLALVLMMRSVPYLLGTFGRVRDAARARGLERRLPALVTPVVMSAVAYAHATGDALAARGLGDDEADDQM